MHLTFVPGTYTSPESLNGWERYLFQNFSASDINIIKKRYSIKNLVSDPLRYVYEEVLKVLSQKEDNKKIILAHSAGGIIVLKALSEIREHVGEVLCCGNLLVLHFL